MNKTNLFGFLYLLRINLTNEDQLNSAGLCLFVFLLEIMLDSTIFPCWFYLF